MEEVRSAASESRESKIRLERVRERGTLSEKKAPILLEMTADSFDYSHRGELAGAEQSRGLELKEDLLNCEMVVSIGLIFGD